MKNLQLHKSLLLITIVFLLLNSINVDAQKSAPNFESNIEWTSDSTTINLIITIKSGVTPYKYQLFDKLPSEGGVLVEEESQIQSDRFTIALLEPKNYFLIISDKTSLRNGRPIYIKK